jgi:effector-binding domain-containing protein
MIGGALTPHRTDYDELRKANPTQVIYVCDNDFPGKSAIEVVSRCYLGKLKHIKFNDNFPQAWDLADPIPPTFFKKDENGTIRFRGDPLESYEQAATWATDNVHDSKTKVIRAEFAEEWRLSVLQDLFVHVDYPDAILTASQFDRKVDHFSDVPNTSALLRKRGGGKAVDIMYSPALPPGIYKSSGNEAINTHKGSYLKPEPGDPQPFIDYMKHLIPDEGDREHLMRWCCTLIARPDIKMHYGVLLISEPQGVGKTTLGQDFLAPIVGEANVSYPSEADITDSNYNYWAAHKRLAVVNEIYAGSSSKAYDRLKSTITDTQITIHKKYQADYVIENWLHIFACSNSQRALLLSNDDRRWLIPGVTDEKPPPVWWDKLHTWRTERGGLQIIMRYAAQWIKEHGPANKGDAAPETQAKQDAYVAGWSQGQLRAADYFAYLKRKHDDEPWVVFDRDVQAKLAADVYNGQYSKFLEKPLTIRRVANHIGLFVSKHFIGGHHIRVITNKRQIALMSTWDKTYTNFKPSGMRRNVVADFAEMDKETELSM